MRSPRIGTTTIVVASFLMAVALLVIALPRPVSEHDVRDSIALGALAFADNCVKCHQLDGHGERALYPSLHNPDTLADKDLLIKTVLNGRVGHMKESDEGTGRLMPSMGFLSNREIADIIAFMSNRWGKKVLIVTPGEVQAAR